MTIPVSIHPTTEIMNTTTPLVIEAGDNLLEYDALLQGYRELLEQAKKQLEDFEITDSDWARLAGSLARRVDTYRVAAELGYRLRESLNQQETPLNELSGEERDDRMMLKELVRQLSQTVLLELQERVIRDQVRLEFIEMRKDFEKQLQELRETHTSLLERQVNNAVQSKVNTEVTTARIQADAFESLIQRSFGQQFRRLAKEAAAEMASKEAE